MSEKKETTQAEMVSFLEANLNADLTELEERLTLLKHGETKRLLMAAMSYPAKETDFTSDREELIRAYSACKRISDSLVALGAEVLVAGMMEQQLEQQKAAGEVAKEETNG